MHSIASLPDAVLPDTAEALVFSGTPFDVVTELRDASLLIRDGHRLLKILVDAPTSIPSRPLSEDALVSALWLGEKMSPAAATNRLHNALSLLQKSGLKDRIVFTTDGYLLEPSGYFHVLPPASQVLARRRAVLFRDGAATPAQGLADGQ